MLASLGLSGLVVRVRLRGWLMCKSYLVANLLRQPAGGQFALVSGMSLAQKPLSVRALVLRKCSTVSSHLKIVGPLAHANLCSGRKC